MSWVRPTFRPCASRLMDLDCWRGDKESEEWKLIIYWGVEFDGTSKQEQKKIFAD